MGSVRVFFDPPSKVRVFFDPPQKKKYVYDQKKTQQSTTLLKEPPLFTPSDFWHPPARKIAHRFGRGRWSPQKPPRGSARNDGGRRRAHQKWVRVTSESEMCGNAASSCTSSASTRNWGGGGGESGGATTGTQPTPERPCPRWPMLSFPPLTNLVDGIDWDTWAGEKILWPG